MDWSEVYTSDQYLIFQKIKPYTGWKYILVKINLNWFEVYTFNQSKGILDCIVSALEWAEHSLDLKKSDSVCFGKL